MKKLIISSIAVLSLLAFVLPAAAKVNRVDGGFGPWDVTGAYVINVEYQTVNYPETLVLSGTGNALAGSLKLVDPVGGSPWTIDSGSVVGNTISLHGFFDSNPAMKLTMTGTIAADGSMSGTWADVTPGTRTGTWNAPAGSAHHQAIVYKNHGQYVKSQENKHEAAHSRIGMPEKSKGHNKSGHGESDSD